VTHISFPPELYRDDSLKIEVNIPGKLPERDKNAHKGDFGDVLFIAGASNYYGAPFFSALSFLKSGGGYSRLAAPLSMSPFIANKGSEIVLVPLKETDSGSIALENSKELLRIAAKRDMIVLGPGLSLNAETQELVSYLVERVKKPILLDGDGITALSSNIEIIRDRMAPTILTPHLGEMSRIVDKKISDIKNNKIDLIQEWAKKLNAVIVLKGAHTLIGSPDEHVFVNMSGNSGMASAGSGDVLTGTIAAMYGLGLPLIDAVQTGVFLHGYSGDIAAADKGEDGITAQDILDYLPYALKDFRQKYDNIWKDHYQSISIL
jgi:NAD(P)H-hydrate epimerase